MNLAAPVRRIMNSGNALTAGKLPLRVHLALVLVLLVCSASASRIAAAAKVCEAADPALNLTKDSNDGVYQVVDDGQLQRICACTTIDYVFIIGCPTCSQGTLDACRLESISGKAPYNRYSLLISGLPLITSLRGLARLSGALLGGLDVDGMDKLTTLEGLGNITRIGQDSRGTSIALFSNPKLASAMALSNAGNFTSNVLLIQFNPQLACVPEQWHGIGANGKALHDPCLFSCNSTTFQCQQTATGTRDESACAFQCASEFAKFRCVDNMCVVSATGHESREDCEVGCGH